MGNIVSRCVQEVRDIVNNCRAGRTDDDSKVLYTFPKEDLEKYKIRTAPNNVVTDTSPPAENNATAAVENSTPEYARIEKKKENFDGFRIDRTHFLKGHDYVNCVHPEDIRKSWEVKMDYKELQTDRRQFQGDCGPDEEEIRLTAVHLCTRDNRFNIEKDLLIARKNFDRTRNGKHYDKSSRISDPGRQMCDVGVQVGGIEKCRRKSASVIKYADNYLIPKLTSDKHLEEYSLFDEPNDKTSSDPVCALEQRQEDVLQRLVELQQSVQKLSQKYGVPFSLGGQAAGMAGADSPIQPGVFHDIVIQADPSRPPLSLLVLYQRLAETYKVLASTFVHSSATLEVPDNLKDIFKNGGAVPRRDAQVCLTLIWKKVKNGPILMVNTAKQSPIFGEANIARYIERILNPAYDSADIIMATQSDEWLDMADLQVTNGNNKEKAAAVRSLNSRLGRNDWLVGSSLSLADIVMWSALTQSGQTAEVPNNVKKWVKACNDSSMFKQALSVLG
ncbi:aminoacyl tRNA synthase complex-interacting multifunctional protein 2-like [Haliotis rufescens]|uniref:aminoacyl tRNA synthase complex-interacting multifunctional protein 2-like n=1 Tax=Haliotis rufescens TaxID=6454 RepID=UPI001EB0459A|nr:aminoacyl tRNA synthase complex-interacting multifunctional protein 2-like [Haliotis rufescens]